LTQYLSPTTVFVIKKSMEIKMSAHVVELKNTTAPCSSGTARAFRQRVKHRRAAQGRKNQQAENLYGLLVG
jgi:hypothetical protein